MFNYQNFGKKIRTLRRKRGLTLAGLAMELNIYHSYLSKIDRGEQIPSVDIAVSLANYFNISFDEYSYNNLKNEIIIHEILEKLDPTNAFECKFIYKALIKFISMTAKEQ